MPPTDEELLRETPRSRAAFGEFYERHERTIGAFFMRCTRDPELAADLTAETFAAALMAAGRYRPEAPAIAWLFGIARNVWLRSLEHRRVEDRARRRLGVTVELTDDVLRRFEHMASDEQVRLLLDRLPATHAEAVRQRVLEDATYDEIAQAMRCSRSVARQRVSRGLRALRGRLS